MGVEHHGILSSDHLQSVARVCKTVWRHPAATRWAGWPKPVPTHALVARAPTPVCTVRIGVLRSCIDGRCTGGDLPALVGQYVVPNRGCPAEIEEDAAGMAGCITRIIRSDGRVETDIKEHMDETNCAAADEAERMAGGGRDIVFVRWSVDGVERGCHDAHTFLPASACCFH